MIKSPRSIFLKNKKKRKKKKEKYKLTNRFSMILKQLQNFLHPQFFKNLIDFDATNTMSKFEEK